MLISLCVLHSILIKTIKVRYKLHRLAFSGLLACFRDLRLFGDPCFSAIVIDNHTTP